MEKLISQNVMLLNMVQASLDKESFTKSSNAGKEIWDKIKEVSEKYDLNITEMLNATLSCNITILEEVNEELKKAKKEIKEYDG